MHILTCNNINRDKWSRLVQSSSTGTWFQTPEAYEFFASMRELFSPFAIGVEREKKLTGVCVSQTMTSEAAVLGTPSIRCNTFVGRIHYLEEEEHKYGMTYGFTPENSNLMFAKIEELLAIDSNELKSIWATKREVLLNDKIDYTAFLTWFVENYPDSAFQTRKANDADDKEFWKKFK